MVHVSSVFLINAGHKTCKI